MNKKIMKGVFPLEVALVEAGKCPVCALPIDQEKFRDQLSRKEFTISGICQICQDDIFKEND
jgi:hypothetical protein